MLLNPESEKLVRVNFQAPLQTQLQTQQNPKMLIGGQWVASRETYDINSPIDGSQVGQAPVATAANIEQAIVAAQASLKTWGKLSGQERGRKLTHAHVILEERLTEIAQLYSVETGKPAEAAQRELSLACRYLSWFATEAQRVRPEILASPAPTQCVWVLPRPLGVVAIFTPAHFAVMMLIRQIAPALAAGCGVIVQPAPNTALTVLAIAKVLHEAGVFPGSLNVVTAPSYGNSLAVFAQHTAVHKLVLAGELAQEPQFLNHASRSTKRINIERFGPAPLIVFEDADLDLAVDAALRNKLLYSGGQACLRSNRIFVHESVAERFIAAFVAKVDKLTILGLNDIESNGQIAPLMNQTCGQQLDTLVTEACEQGAKLRIGGQCLQSTANPGGAFYAPTVLTDVGEGMAIVHQEISGPVVLISRFDNDEELHDRIQCAAAATYLFTENLGRVFEWGECLNTALIGTNDASFLGHEILADSVFEQSQNYSGCNGGVETYLSAQNMLMRPAVQNSAAG